MHHPNDTRCFFIFRFDNCLGSCGRTKTTDGFCTSLQGGARRREKQQHQMGASQTAVAVRTKLTSPVIALLLAPAAAATTTLAVQMQLSEISCSHGVSGWRQQMALAETQAARDESTTSASPFGINYKTADRLQSQKPVSRPADRMRHSDDARSTAGSMSSRSGVPWTTFGRSFQEPRAAAGNSLDLKV